MESEEQSEQFVVEKIVNKRTRKGVVQYLIKWTGCDDSQNTWEPEQNLKCDALLEQFHQERAAEPKKRGQRLTRSLPSDGEQVIDNEGPVVKVEKKDDEKPPASTKQTKYPARRKVGKKSQDTSQEQPQKPVVKAEIKEQHPTSGEMLSESRQEKAVAPKSRGRTSKKSFDSDQEGSVVKVEKKDDEQQATDEPKKKRAKKSLDSSQGDLLDEGAVLVEKVEKNDGEKKRSMKPRRKMARETSHQATEANGNGNGFARGYSVENLVGITQEGNVFMFLVKWQGIDELEMVPSSEVRKFVPEMLPSSSR